MSRSGGEVAAIPLPVVSGPRASTVHGLAGRRRIQIGDLIGIDICGVYHRYHANMARTFSVGEPSVAVRKAIDAAYGAMPVFDSEIKPWRKVDDVLSALEDYYRSSGLLGSEWWVGGYELGVAFPPDWVGEFLYSMGQLHGDLAFEPGDVLNFEANFYLPEHAGVALAINSAIVEESGAGLVNGTPSELTVIEP